MYSLSFSIDILSNKGQMSTLHSFCLFTGMEPRESMRPLFILFSRSQGSPTSFSTSHEGSEPQVREYRHARSPAPQASASPHWIMPCSALHPEKAVWYYPSCMVKRTRKCQIDLRKHKLVSRKFWKSPMSPRCVIGRNLPKIARIHPSWTGFLDLP